jgi:hypothetical protein
MKSRVLLRSPAVEAALTCALYAIFVVAVWNARGRDVTRFIVLGGDTVDETKLPSGVSVLPNSAGYDGTAFYRLALNPFTRSASEFGIPFDMPAYRHQRILYPLLVWALSLGQAGAVPLMLIVVNLLAIALLGFCGACIAQHFERPAWFGAIVAFYPGFLYSLSRDLCEPLACAFALAAILAIVRQRPRAGAVLLTCAILTRETFIIVAFACLLAYVVSRVRGAVSSVSPIVFVLPFAVFVVWQFVLTMVWGTSPMRTGAHHVALSFPFADYWNVLRASSSLRRIHRLHFTEALLLGMTTIAAVVAMRRSIADFAWKVAWLGYIVLASTMISHVWNEDVSYMRVLSDLHLLSATIVLGGRSAIVRWIFAGSTAMVWYYLATHLVKYA